MATVQLLVVFTLVLTASTPYFFADSSRLISAPRECVAEPARHDVPLDVVWVEPGEMYYQRTTQLLNTLRQNRMDRLESTLRERFNDVHVAVASAEESGGDPECMSFFSKENGAEEFVVQTPLRVEMPAYSKSEWSGAYSSSAYAPRFSPLKSAVLSQAAFTMPRLGLSSSRTVTPGRTPSEPALRLVVLFVETFADRDPQQFSVFGVTGGIEEGYNCLTDDPDFKETRQFLAHHDIGLLVVTGSPEVREKLDQGFGSAGTDGDGFLYGSVQIPGIMLSNRIVPEEEAELAYSGIYATIEAFVAAQADAFLCPPYSSLSPQQQPHVPEPADEAYPGAERANLLSTADPPAESSASDSASKQRHDNNSRFTQEKVAKSEEELQNGRDWRVAARSGFKSAGTETMSERKGTETLSGMDGKLTQPKPAENKEPTRRPTGEPITAPTVAPTAAKKLLDEFAANPNVRAMRFAGETPARAISINAVEVSDAVKSSTLFSAGVVLLLLAQA